MTSVWRSRMVYHFLWVGAKCGQHKIKNEIKCSKNNPRCIIPLLIQLRCTFYGKKSSVFAPGSVLQLVTQKWQFWAKNWLSGTNRFVRDGQSLKVNLLLYFNYVKISSTAENKERLSTFSYEMQIRIVQNEISLRFLNGSLFH